MLSAPLLLLSAAVVMLPLPRALESQRVAPSVRLKQNAPKFWSVAYADSLMARYPDPDSIPHRAWCYTQGYILRGFEMLADKTGEAKYFNYLKRFVDQHVDGQGNIRGFRGDTLDDIMAGTTIVAVFKRTGQQRYKLAADRVRNAFRTYPRNADGGFWHANRTNLAHEMWIDGVFMGQMFLLRYGEVIGDQEYCYSEATKQILVFANHGRKPGTGLYVHAYDEDKTAGWADPKSGLSPEVWSEGLGWYALVISEALRVLPADHPDRAAIVKIMQEMVVDLAKTQDPKTGLWYQVVDKGDRPDNWHDSSGSGMFIYAIQRAIDLRLVSRDKYKPVVEKGYRGLLTKAIINRHYKLIDIYDACDGLGVQKSYADYINYPKRINAKEAMGSFLWATFAVEEASLPVRRIQKGSFW
jgi:rhamnogalacturonyl hydrolase YesR